MSAADPRVLVEPAPALSAAEQDWLSCTFLPPGAGERADCRLRIVDQPPWPLPPETPLPESAPAALQVVDGRIRVLHRRYLAEIDPLASTAVLFRRRPQDGGLGVALQTALASRLPFEDSLPLHAAGVILGEAGLAFFGPSGAGKSTLAATFAGELLSDELVVVQGSPFRLHASGFWGTIGRVGRSHRTAPLTALVELRRGPAFSIEPLERRTALQRLVEVVLLPLHPLLWSAALGVLGRLVREVPVYRMRWCPDAPPWRELEALAEEARR